MEHVDMWHLIHPQVKCGAALLWVCVACNWFGMTLNVAHPPHKHANREWVGEWYRCCTGIGCSEWVLRDCA